MYNKRTLNKDTKASKEPKSISTPRDIIYDPMGQWTNPYQPTRVPGSNMTMQGVPYAVLGIGSTGQQQMMYPGAEYMFPGADYVDEYPMMQFGGAIDLELTDEEIDEYKKGGYIVEELPKAQKGLFNFNEPDEYVGYQGRVPVSESTRVANTYRPTQQEIKATKEYSKKVGDLAQDIKKESNVSQKVAMQQAEQILEANSRIQPEAKPYANTKQAQERDAYVFNEGMNARDYFRYPLQFLAGQTPTEEERIQDRIRITDPRTSGLDKFMGTVGQAVNLAPEALINTGVGLAFAPSRFSKLGQVADAISPVGTPGSPFNTRAQNDILVEQARRSGEALLPSYMEPYISRRYTPASKEQDIFESFLSPKKQAELRQSRTQTFTPEEAIAMENASRSSFFPFTNKDLVNSFEKLKTLGKTKSIDPEIMNAYNYALKLQKEGKLTGIPKSSKNFDKWLKSQYNQKPIYRVVDVNKDVVNNDIIKKDMLARGLDPTNEYHIADYMGTTVAPAEVINRGRRSGGHDTLLKESNKDILYYSNDPSWLGPRYGGSNPYYVKTFADQLPEGYKNQVLGLRPTSRMRKNYTRDYPGFDINQVPSGVLFEDGWLRVGPNAITPIIGDKGAKVRNVANIVKGSDFERLSNKFFNQGGIVLELDENQIQKYLDGGYIVEELQSYQDGSEVISQYGWDYKKEGDKYLTKPSASNDWVVATGKPLEAIKQKIYKEIPYTKEDKKSDYITNVERLINKGYTLEDLVEKRIGTKVGLSELFPDLVKKEDKEKVKKEPEVVVKSWDKNNNGIPDRVEEEPAEEIKETYSVTDAYGSKSQKQSSPLNYRDKVKEIAKSKSEEVSLKPTILPNVPTWQDYTQGINEGLSAPEYIEAELGDDEIKELEAQGYTVEEVAQPWLNSLQDNVSTESIYNRQANKLDPFGRPLKQTASQEQMQKAIDWYSQTAEDQGLKDWKPESPFSLGDIAGTGSITDVAEGMADLVDLGQTYLQRQSDKNNTEPEVKTKSISELKEKNSETTNEDLETYTNSNSLTLGENIEIKSKRYNPTGRRVYRQELIDLDNTKFGFRNRGEIQEIISKGGSVTSFYPFETKKDIERKNKYPDNATFIGIDTEGAFKTGKLEDFKNTDRVARVFTNLVDEFLLEEDGSVKLKLRNKDNPDSPVPVVMVIEKDENGKEIKKEGSINVLTKKVKDSRNQFGPIQGGRVVLKGSDGKSVLVSGSLNNIYEQFKEIRERTGKPVEIVQLDNGSYNLGLTTKDDKMTSEDLAAYDKLNTSGGNFLYVIDEPLNNDSKSPITQEQKDAASTTINNLRRFVAKTSENIPVIKDVLGDIDITKNIPDYSRFVKSPTADNFREDIIIPDYKYGMSTDDLLKEKGYMGKGIGSDPYIDCSGAVCRVMTSLGKDLGNPLNTNAQKIHNKTKEIKDSSKWKDGDIITFNTEGSKIDHIGFLVIDENTGEKYIAESSRSFQEGRIVPFQQRLDFLYDAYPDMKYYIRRFDK